MTVMPKRLKKHLPRIIVGHSLVTFALIVGGVLTFTFHGPITALLASATSSLSSPPVIMYFTPYGESTLHTGDTADLDLNINSKIPINAIGATIRYATDSLEVVGISKKRSFMDLWTEDTVIKEEAGQVHFSGGTTAIGGLTGTGTVLTLSVKAKKDAVAGDATLSIADLQVLASDGNGTMIDSATHPFVLHIAIAPSPPTASSNISGSSIAPTEPPLSPSADFSGDGKVNIVDMSILTIHILLPYDPRYDLDLDGRVGLSDLSILFARM